MKRKIPYLLALLVIMVALVPSTAALMVDIPFTELVSGSDSVVIGTVTSVESRWDEDQTLIRTYATVSVEENVAKTPVDDTITIVVDGGTVDGITLWVSDTPIFLPDMADMKLGMLLRSDAPGLYTPYGLTQGVYALRDDTEKPTVMYADATPDHTMMAAGLTHGGFTSDQFIQAIRNAEEGIEPSFDTEIPKPVGVAEYSSGQINSLGLTPSTASAGTSATVTITGSGFGEKASRGSPADVVFFFVRDGGTDYWIRATGWVYMSETNEWILPPNPNSLISWSDNRIVTQVPTGVAWRGRLYPGSASSGPVYIQKDDGYWIGPYSLSVPFGRIKTYMPRGGPHPNRWPGDAPVVEYYVYDPGIPGAVSAVRSAANTWSTVPGSSFSFAYAGTTASTVIAENGKNEIIWADDGPGALGLAYTWSIQSTGEVYETDMLLNTYYSWSTNPGSAQYDIESVALHEFGHLLGLADLYGNLQGYPSDTSKVMYGGGIWPGTTNKRILHSADIQGIEYIYPQKPFVTATLSTTSVFKGDTIYIRGIATGEPSDGIAVWVFGSDYFGRWAIEVEDDRTFNCELHSSWTSDRSAGQYFVVVQHPMENDEFDVWTETDLATGQIIVRDRLGIDSFVVEGEGRLQGGDAAQALIDLLDKPEIDDTYVRASFLVQETTLEPVAAFTASPTTGTAPLMVQFTDQSTNSPTSWIWEYSTGGAWTQFSTSKNPSYQFISAGTYSIRLTATNAGGSNSVTRTGYITVTGAPTPAPIAAFTATPTTGTAPLTVQFTDQSTNTPASWRWEYSTGGAWTQFSTSKNPSHTFTTPGTYSIRFTATNAGGSNTVTRTGYIAVTDAPIPPADLPEHSLYLGHTAVSIGYLIGHPVDAQALVNRLISEQGLTMADLWYRIGDGAVLNILTSEEATPAQRAAIQAQLRTYIDENGNAHEIVHQYAVGRIVVGAMNFNDLYIDDVVGVPGATHFSVSEVDIIREIGSYTPLTFMKAGSTTLEIMDVYGRIIATGTVVIPGTFGEHPFEMSLELVPIPDPIATGTITVGAMNFNEICVNDVVGVPGATHFSVSEVDIIRAIGSDNPVTFMKAGSTTLQIYSDADGDTLIATGTLVIPGTFGEHPFEVSLELV